MNTSGSTGGTQSMRRALGLLRLLARHQEDGIDLQGVMRESGLERSTAHRLLSCLLEEQFAERDSQSRRYRLGVDAMQLGFASLRRTPLLDALRPFAQKLARISGDTVFLVIRQGDYALCLLREAGSFPVKDFSSDQGDRHLLGVGAGGLAILATLPDEEIAALYARHPKHYAQAGLSAAVLMNAVRRTREQGYSEIVDRITPGVSGVGVAFPVSALTSVAFSFGAISSRLNAARRVEMGRLLRAECLAWAEGQQEA
ncbi:IclR family transcriptional regulator [Bordetella pseudohinzii]|uniref:Acetate operon repressor n=2 Tax=Bordetella pseudohinzii TaxID=1331258 RepID=A0A0J6EYF1_9BORD|nr:IclR family transcriptional regulator [Bordetella pseudohinzii]KMM25380.1 IclR family transcriptional regulator [Bordetella pseudohinzii]KXA76559.1 IclR family transcriptional regulator [Bordetella pseudohinzii]KXA81268.1 IclR family transcriptional regulator [Bordetella pseudohinzii]CUJ03745.1 Acetate operon repressor [Bordetella pseudohinzii]